MEEGVISTSPGCLHFPFLGGNAIDVFLQDGVKDILHYKFKILNDDSHVLR